MHLWQYDKPVVLHTKLATLINNGEVRDMQTDQK